MIASRAALRATRAVRVQPVRRVPRAQHARFQSTSPASPKGAPLGGSSLNSPSGGASSGGSSGGSSSGGSFHPALVGGVSGSMIALAGIYMWYHFSGAKSVVKASRQTKAYIDSVSQKFQEGTPEPSEALRWLRQTSTYYAGFVPGASGYVNTAFDDVDKVREKHGDEVDEIISQAWEELRQTTKAGGADLATAKKSWDIIYKHLQQIGELAGDAAEDILNNHPQLKEKVGGSLDQLKGMGDRLGPEAKEHVDKTWQQISDILKGGFSVDTAGKIKKVVDEKIEVVKKLGDEAWKKGMEQAKPYLEKNPQVKEVVEKNADVLKKGNFQELFSRIKKAVESGDAGELQQYVKKATDKAQKSGMGGLQQYLDKVPGGSEILPKLSQLQEVASKHGQEAEKLMKETIDEISKVLSKKSDQAQRIAEKAEKEAK